MSHTLLCKLPNMMDAFIRVGAFACVMACSTRTRPPVMLTVRGVSAPPIVSYCVHDQEGSQTLWFSQINAHFAIPLNSGALRPHRRTPLPLPRFVPLTPKGLPSTGAPATSPSEQPPCSAQAQPLPKQGLLSWEVNGETVKVSRWGWTSGSERRTQPRSLRVAGLDTLNDVLYIGGADGLWRWPLKSRSTPSSVPIPLSIKAPITRIIKDGSGWWVRGSTGRAMAVRISEQGTPRPQVEMIRQPINFPGRPPELSAPLGGSILRATRGGIALHWGGRALISSPIQDIAPLGKDHIAVATQDGVTVYGAATGDLADAGLVVISELKVTSPVTTLIFHKSTLYMVSPERGIIWADVKFISSHSTK